ncbi:MAG: alpha/beta hydrolase [Anaerolineae bacterium]|nr:alpha/beta hydrolase [Anaerolineae bacterium]
MTLNKSYYADVPDALMKRLWDFRANHALCEFQDDKHLWTYYVVGDVQDEALLLLHGNGGDAETMFRYIEGFAANFRIIAPNIPRTLKNMDEVANGLSALLQHEGIEQVHLVGMSFGAAIAQMFMRRFRTMVLEMVITHAVIPSDHLAEIIAMQRRLMQFFPTPLLLWLSRMSFRQSITNSQTLTSPEQRRFWQAYFDELYQTRLSKGDLLSRARLMLDYHRKNKFKGNDLDDWYGDLLIIQSDADDVVSEGDRGALLGMYTRAYVQTLEGYDHLAPILAADELLSSISNFLLRPDE